MLAHVLATRIVESCRHVTRDPNVLAVGIGYKRRRRTRLEELALLVTVAKKKPRTKVPRGYLVPENVSEAGLRIQTDVVTGRRKYFRSISVSGTSAIGMAIRPEGGAAGTLGAILDDQRGKRFALSCSHVLTDFGRAGVVGHPILDGVSGATIGVLARFVTVIPGAHNLCDAAMAELIGDFSSAARNVVPLRGLGEVQCGDEVEVIGVHSRKRGRVSQLGVEERVFGWADGIYNYCWMSQQIEVEDVGERGDSGAIVLNQDGQAVGLFIADNGARDLMTPIDRVLDTLASPAVCVRATDDDVALALQWSA
jgi:hypothetical protein